MRFPDRLRLPLDFDPIALRRDLAAVSPTPWTPHFVPENYEGDWSVLPLRAPAGETHPLRMIYSDPAAAAFVDTPLLAASPAFSAVVDAFGCEVCAVRLMRLAPGSRIKTHADHDLAAEEGRARLHVPITTNPEVEFLVNGRPVVMKPGEVWYLRLSDPHSVANRGATERTHIVLDVVADAWLLACLEKALAAARLAT
jgi:quercetin dioxygenase-like cupin family protein